MPAPPLVARWVLTSCGHEADAGTLVLKDAVAPPGPVLALVLGCGQWRRIDHGDIAPADRPVERRWSQGRTIRRQPPLGDSRRCGIEGVGLVIGHLDRHDPKAWIILHVEGRGVPVHREAGDRPADRDRPENHEAAWPEGFSPLGPLVAFRACTVKLVVIAVPLSDTESCRGALAERQPGKRGRPQPRGPP